MEVQKMAMRPNLIKYAVKSFVRLRENDPTVKPEDGLVWAMEELEPPDMTKEEYQELLDDVINACVEQGHWTIVQDKEYQVLAGELFKDKYQNFAACEPYWRPVETKKVKALLGALCYTPEDYQRAILSAYVTLTNQWDKVQSGEFTSYPTDDAAQTLLDAGKVISTPICYIRKVTDKPKCPKCGCSIMENSPALSRVDNKTAICSACGMKEALEDYYHEA